MSTFTKCRPYARGHARLDPQFHPAPRSSNNWAIGDLCKAYQWPTTGQAGGKVAIIEMGGGFRESDIQAFCAHYGYAVPKLTAVSMDLSNSPGDDADTEVVLDIEAAIAAAAEAGAPLAEVRVYFSQSFADAIAQADADGCDTFSISWGAKEVEFGDELKLIQAAVKACRMSVFAAAGDGGSTDSRALGVLATAPAPGANMDGPSCVPEIVSCGGTTKVPSGNPGEYVWSGTGGGISQIFKQAAWQVGVIAATGRTSPDLAANADPATGVLIYINGGWSAIGGTSFVAPLMAGFFATFGRRLGFVTDKLYANPAWFADITAGNNGQYRASAGIDLCTGLGVPIGKLIAAGMQGVTPVPQPPVPVPPGPAPTPAPPVVNPDLGVSGFAEGPITVPGFLGRPHVIDVKLPVNGQTTGPVPSAVEPDAFGDGHLLQSILDNLPAILQLLKLFGVLPSTATVEELRARVLAQIAEAK